MTAQKGKWARVSIPRELLIRASKVFKKKGMASTSEYVRQAIIKQLEDDERHLGGKESDPTP